MSNKNKICFCGAKKKKPRVRKTETRIATCHKGHYVSASVTFLDGSYVSSGFPCKHSPSYKALCEKMRIVIDAIELFDNKQTLKRFGARYKLVQS